MRCLRLGAAGEALQEGVVALACRGRGSCRRATPRSRPRSRPAPSSSVTMTAQSVARTSAARASPRRVGLMPTMAAPARAAPFSQKRYSAPLGRSTPMCGLASPKRERARAPRVAPSCTASRQVQRASPSMHPGAVVVGAGDQQVGDGRHGSAHPGVRRTRRGRWRRRWRRRRVPWCAAARLRTSAAAPPRRRPRRWPGPTATGARPGSPAPRAPAPSPRRGPGARRRRRRPRPARPPRRRPRPGCRRWRARRRAGGPRGWTPRRPPLRRPQQRTASSARCTPLTTTGSALSPASHPMSSGVSAGSNSLVTTAMNPPSRALSVLSPARLGRARSSGRCTPMRHSRRRRPETGASTVRTSAR